MGLALRLARQLANPSGLAGRLIGNAMDVANRRPTQLALDLLAACPGEKVLDAGCGTGAALDQLLETAAVAAWGIDSSPTMLAAARCRLGKRAQIEAATIEAMAFAEGFFDAALALNVLYFSDGDGNMVRQLHRILRPGGRIVVYVTRRDSMEGWPFAREGVHRLYDAAELAEALVAGGFAPKRISVHEHAITASVCGLVAMARKD